MCHLPFYVVLHPVCTIYHFMLYCIQYVSFTILCCIASSMCHLPFYVVLHPVCAIYHFMLYCIQYVPFTILCCNASSMCHLPFYVAMHSVLHVTKCSKVSSVTWCSCTTSCFSFLFLKLIFRL